ncbi:MAG: hypothetical protein COU06_01635 [Candidatus Harrisonbacteria bacterium CG10_big_fil_rev_8_21_14_0_10_38_8]|uniref:Glycosyltransferase subfamily 4-like N-terminal domain-containing protein n=1 Tax=Candidatus Harrisonbacteria bacterium CG10_big_fil_rev_8_21_14_0_10_38_8 TaxID=1974582 RepID=A0A2M6WJX4_9BACT|nr:MAG: hypothetical protein COU06_01635 [Candidatus Harrisonbacteria bacterium CG10_big_fil_rev_8_21_14_0_10_38_8]
MKVLQVITKGELGGAQNLLYTIITGMINKGAEVVLGYGSGTYLANKLGSRVKSFKFRYLRRSYNPITGILFIIELYRVIQDEKPDVLHIHSSNALLGAIAGKLAGVKTVFTLGGLSFIDPSSKGGVGKFLLVFVYRFLLRYVDVPVFVCKANKKYALKKKLIKSGLVVYNAVDEDYVFLDKTSTRYFFHKKYQVELEDKFVFGSIGRLAYPKNYSVLFYDLKNLLREVPNAFLLLIGDGPELKIYQRIVKKLKLEKNVLLTGSIEDAGRLIRAFDLFVLPSFYEGLSITLLEAYMAKVVSIGADVGGNVEVLGVNHVYPLDNDEARLRMIKRAGLGTLEDNQRVEGKFSSKVMIEQYWSIYLR